MHGPYVRCTATWHKDHQGGVPDWGLIEFQIMEDVTDCYRCNMPMTDVRMVGQAVNMGFGSMYWCTGCKPPMASKEAADLQKRVINPHREKKRKRKR